MSGRSESISNNNLSQPADCSKTGPVISRSGGRDWGGPGSSGTALSRGAGPVPAPTVTGAALTGLAAGSVKVAGAVAHGTAKLADRAC